MKIERILSIIILLLDKEMVSASQLAEKFEVSRRTIFRDIETLEYAGFPIISQAGRNGGFSLVDSYKMKNLTFSDQEKEQLLETLTLKQHLLDFTDQQSVLLEKIKMMQTNPQRENNRLSIESATLHRELIEKQSGLKMKAINKALKKKQKLFITYVSIAGAHSERKIQPIQLCLLNGSWYLEAFCEKRQAIRQFKMTRIREMVVLNETFDKEWDLLREDESFLKTEVVLSFFLSELGRLYDHFVEDEIEIKEKEVIVTFLEDSSRTLIPFLLMFGNRVRVISPKSYQQMHQAEIYKMTQIY